VHCASCPKEMLVAYNVLQCDVQSLFILALTSHTQAELVLYDVLVYGTIASL
jgi:hypothetical protein